VVKPSPRNMAKPAAKKAASKSNKKSSPVKAGLVRKSQPGQGRTARLRSNGPGPARSGPAKLKTPRWSWHSLSAERKLDVLGVVLALVGLLTILSLLSSRHAPVTGWLVSGLYKIAGWGSFVLPVALVVIGLWLVFRNIERLPLFSPERLVGIILLYLNLLSWIHTLARGGFELAHAGGGGGYIGAIFEYMLTTTLGFAGAVVVLLAWLLISLAFTLDLSIPEIFRAIAGFWAQFKARLDAPRLASSGQAGSPVQPGSLAQPGSKDQASFNPGQFAQRPGPTGSAGTTLPSAFQPIRPLGQAQRRPGNGAAEPPLPGEFVDASGGQDAAGEVGGSGAEFTPQVNPSTEATAPHWVLPTIEAILDPPEPATVQANADQARASLIEETLASFGAPAHIVEVHRGPTVTQYGVEPDFIENRQGRTRVRVGKIAALADDLALALAAPRIRIQAPVPGRNYVGIEVPNTEVSRVTLREVMESEVFQRIKSQLKFALGKDVSGKACCYDLASMPHLLIAGTTGSGKSVCVNAILAGFLLNNSPADLRLILVDPKRVELTGYNGIPHLLAPVVTDAERVVGALQWMLREMDSRYHKFSKEGVRNILEYNSRHPERHMEYLVVVIDELADLMMLSPEETERSITRLAQLARATGIHLILATQRPSTDVVTGLIKANFPARIAFAVASNIDSRVILDQPGAERLLGRGDMLFQAPDAAAPVRLQGVHVTDPEIQRLVDYWRFTGAQFPTAQPAVMGGPIDTLPTGVPLKQISFLEEEGTEADPLLKEAIELVRKEGRASITMLQRRMRIGYTRSARLVDMMEDKGIVGPPQSNTQVREVLDYGQTAPPEDDGY
jgi:DNA segregation ATPase FtsK/SpoIIIE, S-DNA-T family